MGPLLVELGSELLAVKRRVDELEKLGDQPVATFVMDVAADKREVMMQLIKNLDSKYRLHTVRPNPLSHRLEVQGDPAVIEFLRLASRFLDGSVPTQRGKADEESR